MYSQLFLNRGCILWCYLSWSLCLLTCIIEGYCCYMENILERTFNTLMESILNPTHDGYSASKSDFYDFCIRFICIELITLSSCLALRDFVSSHIYFRWRTILNSYYIENWQFIRHIEGAAQRVQDDCDRFTNILTQVAVALMSQACNLFFSYSLVIMYSDKITNVPFFGSHRYSLLLGIICIELFALIPLLFAGRKLPIIEYENQTREAQFRKMLIMAENDERIFNINTTCDSFARIRENIYKMYFHLTYIDVTNHFIDLFEWYICGLLLVPALIRGELSYSDFCGADSAILLFLDIISTVRNYWPKLIELTSIHRRLIIFENLINRNKDKEVIYETTLLTARCNSI
ncbi:hypothetical protein ACR3K2_02850 [Cryptosporidium serpentis]